MLEHANQPEKNSALTLSSLLIQGLRCLSLQDNTIANQHVPASIEVDITLQVRGLTCGCAA